MMLMIVRRPSGSDYQRGEDAIRTLQGLIRSIESDVVGWGGVDVSQGP